MIQIARVTNPELTTDLMTHLTLPHDGTPEVFEQQLRATMISRPESVFVLEARSDVNGLVGFVIATLGQDKIVNLLQAWVNPKTAWEVAKELQHRLMFWAVGNSRSQIEVRTERSSEAMYRRFGFEESAKILVQTIPENFVQELLISLRETANG